MNSEQWVVLHPVLDAEHFTSGAQWPVEPHGGPGVLGQAGNHGHKVADRGTDEGGDMAHNFLSVSQCKNTLQATLGSLGRLRLDFQAVTDTVTASTYV